ncbi:MAG: PorV/PorQ family protein [Fibrobacterota bacterium]
MKIVFFIYVFFLAQSYGAPSDAGSDNFEFLRLGHNARPMAMGGAYTAASGHDGLYWNPASISGVSGNVFMLSYRNYVLDTESGFPALIFDLGKKGRAAFGLNYFNGGDFYYTDQFGVSNGNFNYIDIAPFVSYARTIFSYFDAGANFKIIRSSVNGDNLDMNSTAFSVDFGGIYRPAMFKRVVFGMVLKDAGFVKSGFTGSGDGQTLPTTLKFGLKYSPVNIRKLSVNLDLHAPFRGYYEYRGGLEYQIDRNFSVMGGYRLAHQQVKEVFSFFTADNISEEETAPEQFYTWSMGCGMNFGRFLADVAVFNTDFQICYELSVSRYFNSQKNSDDSPDK